MEVYLHYTVVQFVLDIYYTGDPQTKTKRKEVKMDWNKFMLELRNSGVREITLKFSEDNNQISHTQHCFSRKTEKPVQKIDKAAVLESFRKDHNTYFTVDEIASAIELSEPHVRVMVRDLRPTTQKIGKRILVDAEELYIKRSEYETHVLKKDGHYRGGVRFVADKIAKLVN